MDGNGSFPTKTLGANPSAPCKACTAFKDWAKVQKTRYDAEKNTESHAECPLDKEELGTATWGFLHTMAAYYPESPSCKQRKEMVRFFRIFANFYPCKPCADDLRVDLHDMPPEVESRDSLSQWLCKLHNRVNVKLGKPMFDCNRVMERWKDGWKDGSCDRTHE